MSKKDRYIETLNRINEQIAYYMKEWFTPLNPREHLFELLGWRNYLSYWAWTESERLKKFKQSNAEYTLLYMRNLKDLLNK
jgi:hypothetical protein